MMCGIGGRSWPGVLALHSQLSPRERAVLAQFCAHQPKKKLRSPDPRQIHPKRGSAAPLEREVAPSLDPGQQARWSEHLNYWHSEVSNSAPNPMLSGTSLSLGGSTTVTAALLSSFAASTSVYHEADRRGNGRYVLYCIVQYQASTIDRIGLDGDFLVR